MDIQNILVAGNYEEEFQKQVPANVRQTFRFVPVEDVTEEDLSWADAYVGPSPCKGFHFADLKWVHTFNAGVNNYLEIKGWEENGILLTRTVCSFGQRMSEYCLSYILRDLQLHSFFSEKQAEKTWEPKTPKMLRDLNVVIFGTGETGQGIAKAFASLGVTVYGVSHSGRQKEYFQEVVSTANASAYLAKADWVITTLPLTDGTRKLFNSQLFNEMNGASFINVGRGATVDEPALVKALDAGMVNKAILDVVTIEPLPETSPFWDREDVVITPHISAVTEIDEAVACFVDTLQKVVNDESLPNKVDFSRGY